MFKKNLLIILASLLSIISPTMEWGGVSLGEARHFGFNGIESNYGKIFLVLSLIVGLLAIIKCYLRKYGKIIDIVTCIISTANLVILLVTAFSLNDVITVVNQLNSLGVSASIGIGLIISSISTLLIFVISIINIFVKDETSKTNIKFDLPFPKIPKKFIPIMVPIISILLGMFLGAIIMWAFSYDALWGYELLFKKAFGSIKSWGNISRAMGPLILVALGFSVASRAGFFNVGLPGQAFAGWIMATWFALSFPNMPRLLMIPMTVLIAAIAGGFIGAIPGFLRAYLGTSEVIITIMMNYIVLYGGNALIHSFPASLMENKDSTIDVGANAVYQTEWLRNLTDKSQMNIGIFFAIIAVVVIWFLMKKTTLGFEIRAVGLNANAAEYAGMSAKRTIILSMIISGALAGIGGVAEGLGIYSNVYVQTSSMSVGFNGMAVALLAMNSPIGIPFAAFLFGALQIGGVGMKPAAIPEEVVQIVTASIIFFVCAHYIIEKMISMRSAKKGGAN